MAHYVGTSVYPIIMSVIVFCLTTRTLLWFKYAELFYTMYVILVIIFVRILWLKDVCIEGLRGKHTPVVQSGLKTSFFLFLFTEVIFFVSVFWVALDAILSPSIWVGHTWPPYGIETPNYLGIPLFGTCVLLRRGVTISWSHVQLLRNQKASNTLLTTIILAIRFLVLQIYEYKSLSFSIRDGIYGSLFYFRTGFHGFHVFVGGLFLMCNYIRLALIHFSSVHHLGYEISIIYWHFVDVVWICLYVVVYYWGS